MKKILVLLSTYNGEQYLRCQMNSILGQIDVQVDILVRDDGSTDSTLNILKEYTKKYDNIKLIKGYNIGCKKSFFSLLKEASKVRQYYDYFAFSDQDDYWMPEKLSAAVGNLMHFEDGGKCALYHSAYVIVDENLNLISNSHLNRDCGLAASLIRASTIGCSMVFNRKLLKEASSIEINHDASTLPYHDLWVYMVACVLDGNIVGAEDYFLKYRQHSSNVIGLKNNIIKTYYRRYSNIKISKGLKSSFAKLLLSCFESKINDKNKNILYCCVNYKKSLCCRLKLLFSKEFKTTNRIINCGFKLSVILGWF